MRRCLVSLVVVAVSLAGAAPAMAAGGLDAPWSGSGTGTTTVVSDGSAGNPVFTYQASGFNGTWTFGATAASARTATVAYDYSGFHSFFQVTVGLTAFVSHDGTTSETPLIAAGPANCCSPPSGGFSYQGRATFVLAPGDTYGFRMQGGNFDSARTLSGRLALTPVDTTPPLIAPTVDGTLGDGGWYTSDVGLTWTVTDAESPVSSATGCGPAAVTTDTTGTTLTCEATSLGGTASDGVTIKRDATAPAVDLSGGGTYTVDDTVTIACSSSDATSGVASDTCSQAAGARPAYEYGLGTTTVSASATDNAGNTGDASQDVTVTVTTDSLSALTRLWVSKAGVAHALAAKLEAGGEGSLGAYRNQLAAQTGKSITADHAELLATLSESL
jgi:hypothetical protein